MDKAEQILNLIKPFVKKGKVLPREKSEISSNINDFVLIFDDEKLVACAGLKNCEEENMGEIYTLVVAENKQNTGLSSKLLEKLMVKAQISHFSKIFALTKYGTNWFVKHGFTQMKITDLPSKRQALFNHQRNSSIFFKEIIKDEN